MDEITAKLFQDEEFLKKVCVMSAEDAQKEFAARGSSVTVDELNEYAEQIRAIIAGGELDEAALEAVAGGAMSKWETFKFAAGIAVGIVIVCYPW